MPAFLFSRNLDLGFSFQWSLRFHFPDFIFFGFILLRRMLFFSEGCCSLPISLTLIVQVPGFPFTRVPQILLDKEIEDWKSALDLELFLVFQTIGIETCQLIILSLLVGQWATTLVLYLPPVVLPSSEFCSWTGYTSVWQCLWA